MTFGLCAPIFAGAGGAHPRTPLLEHVDVSHLAETIVEAERLGYDSLWVADHLLLGRDAFIMEGWTFLSWAASLTRKMRLGNIHLANLFRPPSLMAKAAASLDVVSGGRLDFFFEAGHGGSEREAKSYGFNFGHYAARLAAFEEALQIIRAMWMQDRPSFEGSDYRIEEAICYPKPAQQPHPPVWIGALGGAPGDARNTVVDLMARYADGWNSTPASVRHCRDLLASLEEACSRHGRDAASMRKSLETQILIRESPGSVERVKEAIQRFNPENAHYRDWEPLQDQYLIGDPDTVARRIRDYAELGIDTFMLWFMDYPSRDGLRTFARKVMPYFNEA